VTTEREWVETLRGRIEKSLSCPGVFVKTAIRLPYALHVVRYRAGTTEPAVTDPRKYQTDLLIGERIDESDWVPRVVVECKLGTVTTHDALTYSAKAATHKNIHPYLRYGIVIGAHSGPVPVRLVRHGHQFDFMFTLASKGFAAAEFDQLIRLLNEEVRASQAIGKILAGKSDIRLVHRKWIMTA
jgi:hypothetical protein